MAVTTECDKVIQLKREVYTITINRAPYTSPISIPVSELTVVAYRSLLAMSTGESYYHPT